MKNLKIKYYNKHGIVFIISIVLICFFYDSCKKDIHEGQNDPGIITNSDVSKAKTWYENMYSVSNTHQSTQATIKSDLSQVIKPDWSKNATYNRFNKQVIELPIDPSSKFTPTLNNKTTGWSSNSAYSRSSFILLNNGSNWDAYVMTLIADSTYLKNDLSKLDRNKYNKRDANYSGLLLYFTPNGKYLGGWRYKDGQIVSSGSENGSDIKVQSISTSRLKPTYVECWDYWLSSPSGDVMIYLFTSCSVGDGGTGSNGGSGSGGGSGGGGGGSGSGGGSSPTPPPPCNGAPPIIHSSGNLIVNNVPPDGGGFPPPPSGECTVAIPVPPVKTDSLAKNFPCAVALIINNLGECGVYSNLVAPFMVGGQGQPTLDWTNSILPWNQQNGNGVVTNELAETSTIGNTYSATITLNTKMLQNSTKLIIASTAIHETIHAVINYKLKMAGYNVADGNVTLESWLFGIDSWYTLKGLPSNFSNHYVMLDYFFDNAVEALGNWDNNAHTKKEYQMAMLYGLDNPGDAEGTTANYMTKYLNLRNEFNSILTKYNITPTDLQNFWISQINATNTSDKLPASGCN
jgi:hypothetical protein